jgi:hypothetical protein
MMVRTATRSDAQAITELTIQLGYPADYLVIRDRIEKLMVMRTHILLVALWNEKVSGWMQASLCDTLESGLRSESHKFYPAIGYHTSKTQLLYRKIIRKSAQQGEAPDPATPAGEPSTLGQ